VSPENIYFYKNSSEVEEKAKKCFQIVTRGVSWAKIRSHEVKKKINLVQKMVRRRSGTLVVILEIMNYINVVVNRVAR
jgi:hypothetical protein